MIMIVIECRWPELILVSMQVTACIVMNLVVGCHYLPPSPQ